MTVGRIVAITDAGTRFVVRLRESGTNVLVGLSDSIRRSRCVVAMNDWVNVAGESIVFRFHGEPPVLPPVDAPSTRAQLIETGLLRPDTPPGWIDAPTLRLDHAGRSAAREHQRRGPIRDRSPHADGQERAARKSR